MNRIIPCGDCAERTLATQQLGFKVTGCDPHPTRPGFCVLTFQEDVEKPTGTTSGKQLSSVESQTATVEQAAVTSTQATTARAIINIFETGQVRGLYGQVTITAGDTGHLTFGRAQTTLGSGNLARLLQSYCANQGARFAARLRPFLDRFAAIDFSLDHELQLHNVLRATADDPVMRDTQDKFFDQTYWEPALRGATKLGLRSPLSCAIVYDGYVHGAFKLMADRTTQAVGEPGVAGEKAWVTAYVETRRTWLENHKRTDLRPTVYRMDAFKRLIDQGFWGLDLPLVVRGKEVSQSSLATMPPGCFDGPVPGTRPLSLQSPLLQGIDVRLVQLGLSDQGINVLADGLFGQTTASLIQTWQSKNEFAPNGVLNCTQICMLTK